jgi:hypothetical protein
MFIFWFFSKLEQFKNSIFVKYGFIVSMFGSTNIFLLFFLFATISNFAIFDTLVIIGIILMSNAGFLVLINGMSNSIILSQKNGFYRFLLIFAGPLFFLIFSVGILGIVLKKNFVLGVAGLVFGLVIGFLTALIGYHQKLPKWKKWGFSRAKTAEERKIIESSKINTAVETERLSEKYSIFGSYAFYLLIVAAVTLIVGAKMVDKVELVIATACVSFAFSMVMSYILLIILADKKIREGVKK